MVFAYMAYKSQFSGKAGSLVDQFIEFRMLGLHLERLSDIALADEDISFHANAEANSTLRGQIELKDVVYRYSSSDPIVLHGMSLRIEAGEHVAITGPSGGGKSTLVNIMLGLAEPNSGELLVDGLPLKQFGYKNYHDQVSAVLQDDVLFAGSLADNIALFDDSPDIGAVEEASRMAAIHKDIMQMPMQYETLIGDMGSTLSGGQKQRVLLARALYRRPRILIMDEGTAHLDSEHEKSVNDAISRKKITRIIIAHRKETIESADRILVIRDGQIFN
jgi:ATP-binding cassette subfamily B protein RaxB